MRRTFVTLALLATAPAFASAQDFRWHAALAKGKTLEVRGINGPIRAVAADGQEAEVTAVKRARRGDPASVEIRVVESADGVTICAIYPARKNRPAGTCRQGGDGDGESNDVEVSFEVRVPAGVAFVGSTVNGDVIAKGLPGDARLTSVNGDIEVEAGGVARGTTVNGSITARLGRTDWQDALRFTTVNGGIRVRLPRDASTEVEATTVNGSVESDFPITVRGRTRHGSLRGTIGAGGRTLDLTTVNGNIRLEQGI